MPTLPTLSFLQRLTVAAAASAAFATTSTFAQTINVNFEQYTPGPGTIEVESTLKGPAGGLGESWNQFADEDSAGPLVDASGAPTNVEFTTNFTEGRSGGSGNTPMLRSTLADFGRGFERTLTVTGLEANGSYDIWLTSFRDSSLARERTVGVWSTPNPTTSANPQTIDNRAGRNGETFVEGYNYVLFGSVQADGSGQIVFNGDGADTSEGFDDDYRLGLSGFQIAPGGTREPLELTEVSFAAGADELILTWKSNPGEFYGLYWSEDLIDFAPDVGPAIPASESDNRTTFGPFANPRPEAGRLFVRVGPPDLEDPVLQNLWGNNTTVTLVFSEALRAGAATDPANFTVRNEDVLWPINSAELSEDGTTITLTLGVSLAIGTPYTVTTTNLTDLAGRRLGGSPVANFSTWDNDPNGIKVFILAGQSNMQGHGKPELGHDVNGDGSEDPGAIGSLRYLAVNDTANYSYLLADPGDPANSAWASRSDVKVWWRDSDIGAPRSVKKGNLTTGFGKGVWFGPEYGFGWVMGDHFSEPVLLIKTAWGGKDLQNNFRPPGAVVSRGGTVGPYYTAMIDYVREVLSNLAAEFPAAQHPEFANLNYRYQIAGFAWHQGWNDRIDAASSRVYEDNLVDLINDLRAEFGRPGLPVSIGTTGMEPQDPRTTVELSQLAVADPVQHPEFAGTVFAVDTQPFWRPASQSPSNFGFHWNHNAEAHYLIGDAMGDGMKALLAP